MPLGELPILGFRGLFLTEEGDWASPYQRDFFWGEGINSANCSKFLKQHGIPAPRCECGLYAYHELTDALNTFRNHTAIFAVIGWGESLCIHQDRFRSKHMQVVAVLNSPLFPQEKLLAASTRFGVPLLEEKDFLSYSSEYGQSRYKYNIPPHPLRRLPLLDNDNFNVLQELYASDFLNEKLEKAICGDFQGMSLLTIREEVQGLLANWGIRLSHELSRCNLQKLQFQLMVAQGELLRECVRMKNNQLDEIYNDKEGEWSVLLTRGGFYRRMYLLHRGVNGKRLSHWELGARFPLYSDKVGEMIEIVENDKQEALPRLRVALGVRIKEAVLISMIFVCISLIEIFLMVFTNYQRTFDTLLLH